LSASFDAKAFLKTLTSHPGIYQMLDEEGATLYIGKARNLKKRVSSYFQKQTDSSKTKWLVKLIAKIEVIVTHSENEALLLENNLIKKYKPPYNIFLRDDKSYPYLFLSGHPDFPRLDFHRGSKREKGKYYGPFFSAQAVRESLTMLQKLFRIRQCDDRFFQTRKRPCLQYEIARCTAPCVGYITPEAYQQNVRLTVMFLEGKNQEARDVLVKRMEQASAAQDYERAAICRDQIITLRRVQERQYVTKEGGDFDVIAATTVDGVCCVDVIYIRKGQLLGNKAFFPGLPVPMENNEILAAFLSQFYLTDHHLKDIPKEILINQDFPDSQWLAGFLSEQLNKTVHITKPRRGNRAKWIQMALTNATHALNSHLQNQRHNYKRFEELQRVLSLENIPSRLECFDISHSSGESTVASCVVFNRNGPDKKAYRRFNIKGITGGDDYAAMRQVLLRRYTRLKKEGALLPDIIFIDGGKGQLHQAEKVLQELQVSGVILIGIAKGVARKPGRETLFLSGKTEPLLLKSDSEAFHLIQHIRDEAHRFAITGHRKQRAKTRLTSYLETIPGVGAKRRQTLLQQLGGLAEVKRASIEELAKVPGISESLAKRIYTEFHDR
jgi:excinuclease ABC subunit C